MRLGYIILYVPDVAAAVGFYEQAFGLTRRFIDDSVTYGEMETGGTALSFVNEDFATANGHHFRPTRAGTLAPGVEIALVTDDVAAAFAHAVGAGAQAQQSPAEKPWGQTVAYVRDLNGFLVELCSPMG